MRNNAIIFYTKRINHYFITLCIVIGFSFAVNGYAQELASLEYNGGGDWYANPTSVPNLIRFCNDNIDTKIVPKPNTVKPDSPDIFNYPIVFITGHGNVFFNNEEATNLRKYLTNGGFIEISDNYGIDPYIRREFKKVFPELEFQEIPFSHPIYHQTYNFTKGVPKIHEHNGKAPKGYGLFYRGRLVCFYDYESDLSDGWEAPEMHHDPKEIRLKALQMGANIIKYVFSN